MPAVASEIAARDGLGASAANAPVLLFALASMLSAPFAGRCVDGRGEHVAIRLGLALGVVAAFLRPDAAFWRLVVAQGIAGASFSLITAAALPLVANRVEPARVAIVTGVGVALLLAGLAASLALTPVLARAFGLDGMFTVVAVAMLVLAVPCAACVRSVPTAPRSHMPGGVVWWSLLRERRGGLLIGMSFLLGGAASAVAAVLEQVWAGRGLGMEAAGVAGALFMLGGIAGSFALPWAFERVASGRAVLLACSLAALALTWPLLMASSVLAGDVVAAVAGAFWIGNVPVMLAMLEREAGPARAGSATSLFWATNNLGSMLLVWVVGRVADLGSWHMAVAATLALLGVNLVLNLALPRGARA